MPAGCANVNSTSSSHLACNVKTRNSSADSISCRQIHPPPTLLLRKGMLGRWLIRVYNRSEVVSDIWNSAFKPVLLNRQYHSSASQTWWKTLISRCRTEEASITLHRNQFPQFIFCMKTTIYFWTCLHQANLFPSSKWTVWSLIIPRLLQLRKEMWSLHSTPCTRSKVWAKLDQFCTTRIAPTTLDSAEDQREAPICTGLLIILWELAPLKRTTV